MDHEKQAVKYLIRDESLQYFVWRDEKGTVYITLGKETRALDEEETERWEEIEKEQG